jgi:hypothetical protein
MAELVEGHELALPHLAFGLLHHCAFFRCEHIVGINQAFWLNEHPIRPLRKCDEITLPHAEAFENFSGDNHLTPLADAPDTFLG